MSQAIHLVNGERVEVTVDHDRKVKDSQYTRYTARTFQTLAETLLGDCGEA